MTPSLAPFRARCLPALDLSPEVADALGHVEAGVQDVDDAPALLGELLSDRARVGGGGRSRRAGRRGGSRTLACEAGAAADDAPVHDRQLGRREAVAPDDATVAAGARSDEVCRERHRFLRAVTRQLG